MRRLLAYALAMLLVAAPALAQTEIPGTKVTIDVPATGGTKKTLQQAQDEGDLGGGGPHADTHAHDGSDPVPIDTLAAGSLLDGDCALSDGTKMIAGRCAQVVTTVAELVACYTSGQFFTACGLEEGTRLNLTSGLVLPVVDHLVPRNGGTRQILCEEGAGFYTDDPTVGLEILVIDTTGAGSLSHDMEVGGSGCQLDGAGAFDQIGLVLRGGFPGRAYFEKWGIGHFGLGGPGSGSAIYLDGASYTQIKFHRVQAENTNGSLAAAVRIRASGQVTWDGGRLFDVSGQGGGCFSFDSGNNAWALAVHHAELVCYPHVTDLTNGGDGHTSTTNEVSLLVTDSPAMLGGIEGANAEGHYIVGPGKVNGIIDWHRRRDPSNTQAYGDSTAPMVVYRKTAPGGGGGTMIVRINDHDCRYRPADGVFKGIGASWFLFAGMDLDYRGGAGCIPLGRDAIFDAAWPNGQQPKAIVRDMGFVYQWFQTNPANGVVEALPSHVSTKRLDGNVDRQLEHWECYGQTHVLTGATDRTFTLPTAQSLVHPDRAECGFYVSGSANLCVKPAGTDVIEFPGQAMGPGERICSTEGLGSCVRLRPLSGLLGARWGIVSGCYDWINGGP